MKNRIWRSGVAAFLLSLTAAGAASAQVVRGLVRDNLAGSPVPGVAITLLNEDGRVVRRALTDDEGRFGFSAPAPGTYRIGAVSLGYAPHTTASFAVGPGGVSAVELFLEVQPIVLAPLNVVASARVEKLDQVGFYARQRRGFGNFLTPELVESRRAIEVQDLLRGLPNVRVVRAPGGWDVRMRSGISPIFRDAGRPCYPSVLVDGLVVRPGGAQQVDVGRWSDALHPSMIQAMEVYTSAAGLPPQAIGVSPCGSIVIWTR